MPKIILLDGLFGTGYTLKDFPWWISLVILGVAIVVLGGLYFLFVWLFGRMKFNDEDKAQEQEYKAADKERKREIKKGASKPLKNVLTWKKVRPWLIPVLVVPLVISMLATPVLVTTWDILMTTLSGSKVHTNDTPSALEAAAEAEKNVIKIEEEGIVLLKNEDEALPLKPDKEGEKIKVNVFGACAFGLFYGNGGSGSFQTDGRVSSFPRRATKLEEALDAEGFEINQNLFNFVKNYYDGGKVSVEESNYDIKCGFNKYNYSEIVNSKAPYAHEAPIENYTDTEFDALGGKTLLEDAKAFSDTAIFCITRRGSEDEDRRLKNTSLNDSSDAGLQLTNKEEDIIEMLEDNFEKVIILLNVPTMVESRFLNDSEIDAAVFIGHPGLSGTTAVAEVLNGKVNPSGRLTDTWVYDATSAPSYQNFGNDTTLSHTGGSTGKFTYYHEGIYVGYRYYTTRAMVDKDFKYEDYVQYSFGHGLSYTTFDKWIERFEVNQDEQKVSVQVGVKNTGLVPGREVIQLYQHAPYYPEGGVEKAWYSLCAFEKTNDIEPGEEAYYELEFSFRDIASWSTKKGYYVLEHGDYEVSLRENAWDLAVTEQTKRENVHSFNLAADVEFKKSYHTNVDYKNLFQDVERGPAAEPHEYLTRADFEGSWLNKDEIDRSALSEYFDISEGYGGNQNQQGGTSYTFQDNQIDEDEPLYGEDNGLELADLKDADWDDPNWELLLDQMTQAELRDIVDQGSFKTAKINSINKRECTDYDGPSSAFHSGTGHPSEVVVACSWNPNVAKLMGQSIGREGASRGLTGWYGPGINMHRSPFGGRNFEYYSEDPLVAGLMAGNTSQGTMEYGVYCYAKHYMCNEQENSRAGVFVWCQEQALREIYGRGFELYVEMGGLGIMSSFNCIGSWWTGGSKALCTDLLREEWGFHGVVVTDYVSGPYMAVNIGVRAGNDLWLNRNPSCHAQHCVQQTPHDGYILLRRSAKNILYACAHSNCVWTEDDYAELDIIVNPTKS